MYSIGEISKMFQLPISTLRYYDKEGLFPHLKRVNGVRQFSESEIETLRVIDCLKKSGIPIKDIAQFIDWCMEGDSTLDERLDFMKTHEEQLEEKIKVLEMNLAFLRWKIWYYQTAAEAGTESIHFIPGTTQVKPEIRDIFK